MQYLNFENKEKPQLLSKTEYKEQDTIFKEAGMLYSQYLEYMTLKHQQDNMRDYYVWQAGGSVNEDGEEVPPCGECQSLDGQVFHISEIPEQPHEHCKCGVISLQDQIIFERLDERLEKLEKKVEEERKKQKKLEEFKKSEELRKNIKEAKMMKNEDIITKGLWFKGRVESGGEWDYKQNGGEYEDIGNFNYGVTGSALGFSETTLKAGAGVYQVYSGTSDISFYDSWGDDPVDQEYIQQGIDYYNENYGG